MLRTRTSALAGRADAHSSSPFHRPLAAQLLDEQNPFLDEAAEDAAAREPMNPVKRAKHDLAIALGEYDPELEGRAAWRHLPRSFTASDCGSSPLRRSVTAHSEDGQNNNSGRLGFSDQGVEVAERRITSTLSQSMMGVAAEALRTRQAS